MSGGKGSQMDPTLVSLHALVSLAPGSCAGCMAQAKMLFDCFPEVLRQAGRRFIVHQTSQCTKLMKVPSLYSSCNDCKGSTISTLSSI